MRAYVITTGLVFGLLVVLHIWRVIVEGTQLLKDPWWFLITGLALALAVWAYVVARRPRPS
jgi:tetrahydromethanopterin S-methyltransferase subunit E